MPHAKLWRAVIQKRFICFTIMEKEKGAGVIMREHLANHTFGFYLSISAGILSG